jgi:hypothetical protein
LLKLLPCNGNLIYYPSLKYYEWNPNEKEIVEFGFYYKGDML